MATSYSVKVFNNSLANGRVCLFQKMPDQPAKIFSLAWLTKQCNQGSNVKFSWSIEFCATWAETGLLRPGVTFEAGASRLVDPSNIMENSIGFDYIDGGFTFDDTTKTTPSGNIGFYSTDKIPNNKASIGVGMNGESAFATQALANYNFIFIPKVKYHLVFGNYTQGVAMDLSASADAFELRFPINVYDLELELGEDHCFHLK